jgi:hypothetical protein
MNSDNKWEEFKEEEEEEEENIELQLEEREKKVGEIKGILERERKIFKEDNVLRIQK